MSGAVIVFPEYEKLKTEMEKLRTELSMIRTWPECFEIMACLME